MSDLAEQLKKKLCNKLPSEFKKNLLKALRGRKFKKCVGALYKHTSEGGKYCVMGVVRQVVYPGEDIPDIGHLNNAGGVNSKVPAVFFGKNGGPSEIQSELIQRNDGRGGKKEQSFKELADYIDENL